jgi:flagellar hook-associated protein 1
MGGISGLLETARRALLAQQFGISVTGHNIANAGTTGYSRQRANLVATDATRTVYGMLGTGVTIESISRMRNTFVDQQIRTTSASYEAANSEYNILGQVESIFNEPSDSAMSGVLNGFFSSWEELSTDPSSSVTRNALLLQAQSLVDNFHRLYNDTNTLRTSLRDELSVKVDKINTLTTEISKLNVDIVAAESGDFSAADLRDIRDGKIAELSKLANITVSEDERGASLISVGGSTIVGGATHLDLKVVAGTAATVSGTVFDQMSIVSDNGDTKVNLTGGEAGGILKSFNTSIPDTLGRLNQVAAAIISEVNRVHSAGFGRQSPPQSGVNFFMGTDASSIAIDLTSPALPAGSSPSIDNIAASGSATSTGDNSVALAIAAIIDKRGLTDSGGASMLGGLSISEFYNQSVTSIGSAINGASTILDSQGLVLSNLTEQQDAISGVSLDEEMTDMIKFQRGFEAAARVISTVDEMYQTIISMV